MVLNHVGIMSRSEEQAAGFYRDFLGMEKVREYVVPPELCQQLFSVDREIQVLTFGKGDVRIEVFVCAEHDLPRPNIPHFCLHLENFSRILEQAGRSGIEVISGEKEGKTVYFLRDFSGNMIEIKPA